MEHPENNHPLLKVWQGYLGTRPADREISHRPPIERVIGEVFSMGQFYYYVMNLTNSTLSHHHENILKIHGLKKPPEHLKEILDMVHPDDIEYIMKAEQTAIETIVKIGIQHQLYLKVSYCFRMKTATGKFELFHHQSIHTLEDENRKLIQSINIHTNIQHITRENSYTVLVTGISPRNDFYQIKIDPAHPTYHFPEHLTQRELEVLSLIAKGNSGSEIAQLLILSEHTVRTHRKNILRKTDSRNCKELLKKAFEQGLI